MKFQRWDFETPRVGDVSKIVKELLLESGCNGQLETNANNIGEIASCLGRVIEKLCDRGVLTEKDIHDLFM